MTGKDLCGDHKKHSNDNSLTVSNLALPAEELLISQIARKRFPDNAATQFNTSGVCMSKSGQHHENAITFDKTQLTHMLSLPNEAILCQKLNATSARYVAQPNDATACDKRFQRGSIQTKSSLLLIIIVRHVC